MPTRSIITVGLTALGCLFITLSIAVLLTAPVSAKSHFLGRLQRDYPNIVGTRLDGCVMCHKDGIPDGPLNRFADDYYTHGFKFERIEDLDSDRDGFTNVEELLALTFPGDPQDFPTDAPAQAPATPTPGPPTATPTPTHTPTPIHTPSPTPTATPTHTPEPITSRVSHDPALMLMVAIGVIGVVLWAAVLFFMVRK